MRAFIVLSCLAFAAARPEAPIQSGYSYNRPGGSGGISTGFSGVSGSSFGIGHGGGSFGSSFSSGGSSSLSGFGIGGGSGGGGYSGGGYQSSGAAVVQKHIYVHVPPPEPEDVQPQRQIPVAQAQKHYKIIFIKAPSPPSYQAPIIPVQPQNEEKTLVYVLVKKPEEQQDIVIPTAAPTQPSKPEVYFIKYKTQKESGGAGGYPAANVGSSSGLDLSAPGPIGGGSGIDFGSSGIGSSGIGSSGIGSGHGGSPSTQYGPPGKSGPY
ncbi:uncharacterized protein LOC129578355 [Sitodiplosis mosellana]|uniref:uncharacterized protein LOC129578355 n=1 Tax=Sitodiplosis mosellana TaxID=263140 RepID=UPI002443EE60|nr:uncharacterized protein LOC129578355 [Sitodiplosis mosellana]